LGKSQNGVATPRIRFAEIQPELQKPEAVEQEWNDWHRYGTEMASLFYMTHAFSREGGLRLGMGRFVSRIKYFETNPSSSWVIFEEVDSLVFVRRRERGSA
jgi:hypothetical protein